MGSPLLPRKARIIDVRRETADVITFRLRVEDGDFKFKSGQFNIISAIGVGESAISISSAPTDEPVFNHTIRAIGNVTRYLHTFGVGDCVGIRGPYGTHWPMDDARGKDLLIVSGGIGLAAVKSAIEEALNRRGEYGKITILYGARTPKDMLYTYDYERWRSTPGVELLLTVDRADDREWKGNVGVVTTLFEGIKVDPSRTVAMICGPEIMMRFTLIELIKIGLPCKYIFLSLERRMKCGLGQCGHCMLGPKFICKDGPVFSYEEIKPFFGKGV
jgi:NAD(P)H-flavin reductase